MRDLSTKYQSSNFMVGTLQNDTKIKLNLALIIENEPIV
jgi:hypothetical protein